MTSPNPWRSAEEKPRKNGKYLCIIKDTYGYDEFSFFWHQQRGWRNMTAKLIAWCPIPDGWQQFLEKGDD